MKLKVEKLLIDFIMIDHMSKHYLPELKKYGSLSKWF